MSRFFTLIGEHVIGLGILGYCLAMIGAANLLGRVLRLNERPEETNDRD
jgi:hypothetical protein